MVNEIISEDYIEKVKEFVIESDLLNNEDISKKMEDLISY